MDGEHVLSRRVASVDLRANRPCGLMRKSTRKSRGATSGILDTRMAAGDPQGLGLEFLAALVSSTADGILVLDSDCRIVYANPVACDWLGYPWTICWVKTGWRSRPSTSGQPIEHSWTRLSITAAPS